MRDDSEQQTAWTQGPLQAFGEHKSEHGKFVYAVRETEPRGQIAGYPTPTARYRNRADAQIGALAPELAEWVLEHAPDSSLAARLKEIDSRSGSGRHVAGGSGKVLARQRDNGEPDHARAFVEAPWVGRAAACHRDRRRPMSAHAYKLMEAKKGCPHCGKPNGHAENTKGGNPTVAMCLRYLRTRIEALEASDA